jgi:hypothetical protein
MRSYADVASIVYPEELTVIYPLQIEGRDIYESYGETTGLSVSYDIRDKKVSSMYNLMTHNYQSSAYDAETDVQKIIQTAQSTNGNIYAPVDEKNKDVKKVVLELDTPILGYEHFWRYENSGQNSEFMVPALIFPIKDNPDTGYYGQTRIVVPLIKDFANQNGGPIVVPMMDKATATTGSASSTK